MDFEMKALQMWKHEQQLWSEVDLFGINREIPGPIPPINFPPRLLHISIIATTIIKHFNITSTCFYFCKLWYDNIAVKRFGACENKSLSERENVKKTVCLLFLSTFHNVPSRVQALYNVIDFLRHFVPDTINYGRFYRVLRLSVWRYSTCRSLFSESAQFIFLSSQKPDVHPYIRGTAWHGYDGSILAKWIVATIQRKQQCQ